MHKDSNVIPALENCTANQKVKEDDHEENRKKELEYHGSRKTLF
jgi:hypothetical protein